MGRILVVDDDPDILKMADAVLNSVGHTVFTAEDAVRAMEWLNHIEFDLLISDANMPLYSGFELISTVRKNRKFQNMSVAMLTGLRERKDVERAVNAGVDDYIVKPIDPMILVQKVSSLFQKRPPAHHSEIFLNGTKLSGGVIHRRVEIDAVSELGVRIKTDMPMKVGETVDLQADFFKEIEAETPPMKVLHTEPDPETGLIRAHLIFLGANEVLLQKIRRWLYTHGESRQKSA